MEMQVMIPSTALEFNFDSACTSPYISAPSSPQRFGNLFFSAPTSPTRASAFYREFNNFSGRDTTTNGGDPLSIIPFNWEEKPGIPKIKDPANTNVEDDDDFAFDFSGQLERTSLSADELFDGGKIKPLKPPPRLQYYPESRAANDATSPRSPRSPRKMIKEALSPRHKKKDVDSFAKAIEQTSGDHPNDHHQRGRERNDRSSSSSIRHKGTRSLSPFRISDMLFESERETEPNNEQSTKHSSSTSSTTWYRKWRLKDLLLFRSASEGRATSTDALNKYALLKKSSQICEDVKNSSFRSTDSGGSVSSSRGRRRGPVSAHELHYKVNRAVAEEMRKKTFLPYKQGLLGCLGFNPAVHDISRGFGSLPRG